MMYATFRRLQWLCMADVNVFCTPLLTMLGTLIVVSLGTPINNSRLSDLRSPIDSNHANSRSWFEDLRQAIDDLRQVIDARFAEQKADLLRVEQVMDARLRYLEENRR